MLGSVSPVHDTAEVLHCVTCKFADLMVILLDPNEQVLGSIDLRHDTAEVLLNMTQDYSFIDTPVVNQSIYFDVRLLWTSFSCFRSMFVLPIDADTLDCEQWHCCSSIA